MLLEELLRCQIQEWYPEFRRHTIPTAIIPLPAAFIRYLAGQPACPDPDADEDSEPLPFLLPSLTSGRHPFPPLHAHLPDPVSLLDRDNSDLFFDSADDDCEADNPLRPAFPELEAAIDAAIAELGGAALPKLNWSAPKDATFMSADATIRCTCFAEVAMLLRSSDCVAHDLVSARPSCEDFVRAKGVPWNTTKGSGAEEGARPNAHKSGSQPNGEGSGEGKSDRQNAQGSGDTGARPNGGGSSNGAGSLSVSRETCDEGGRQSAADDAPEEDVGQKSNEMTWVDDGFQYYLALRKWYPGLRPESEFRCFVRGRRLVAVSQRDPSAYYPSLPGWSVEVQPKIEDFFEEVIEPQFASENYTFDVYVRADGKVKLIDFNPWGGYTLPLLFTWEELEEEGRGEEVNFRVVMQQGAVRPGLMTAIPYDMLDWGEGSGWDVFLKKADKELNRQMTSLGLCIFEELVEVEYLARSCSRAMRAVGVVETTCEAIFGLIMSMDVTRYEWDCSFQYGSLVEEVDGHTAILYHRLQLNWCSMLVWPRDICYVRYWRRNDDGSYVVLFRSTEHQNCGPQPGFVRAFIESGGFKISPLKCFNGRPRTQVQHLMQIDLKGWGMNYFPSFQYNSLLQMLNCVAGLREFFSQNDDIHTVPRIPVMHTMANVASVKKDQKLQDADSKTKQANSAQADNKSSDMMDEESEEDDDYQVPEANLEEDTTKSDSDTKCSDPIDLSCFSGIIRQDANEKSRNCWAVPDSKIFKVRSKTFPHDKSKVPAGKYLMELVAIDWFKDTERMDHVARRQGCAAQVAAEKGMFTFVVNIQIPGSSHYSVVLYFVAKSLKKGSLLQRFADGDDDFRNSRLKLIPSVPKGSWIVRQSVGSTPCLLGKAVDCSYMRGPGYLEVDVDIGSSAVANGVLGLVFGVVTTLVVDMAFLVQPSFLLMERLFRGLRRGRGGWSLYHREQQIGLGTTTGLAMHGGGRTNGEARCSIRDQITSRGGFSSQTKGYYHLSEWNSLPVACSLYTNTMQCKVFLFLVLLFSCW